MGTARHAGRDHDAGTAVCRKEASCGRKEKEEGSKGSGCKGSRDRQSSRGGKRKQRVWRSSAAFRLRVLGVVLVFRAFGVAQAEAQCSIKDDSRQYMCLPCSQHLVSR